MVNKDLRYNASASVEPITSSPPQSAAVNIDNNDDVNDVNVTSPGDADAELIVGKKKTRKKRITSRKSEGTDEKVTTEQVGKGFGSLFCCCEN